MLKQQLVKKALFMGAFFVLVILYQPQAQAASCTSPLLSLPEKATVKWVYDGDTVLLTDKRKIRLIGIDTPEVRHHKQKRQAFSGEAREALRELLKRDNYHVLLRFGPEEKDRYARILAHVFTRGGINISEWLLERGLAQTLSIPPNVLLANCYKRAEVFAQKKSLNIWQLDSHQLKEAKTLPLQTKGYVRLKGRVEKVKRNKKSLVIQLESHPKYPIILRIRKKNYASFKPLNLDKLWNRTIIVSGVLTKRKGKRYMYLNHGSQLSVVYKPYIPPIIKWSKQQ